MILRIVHDCMCDYLPSTVPGGSLAKAASEGAKTVSGPLPERTSTRPAALTAAVASHEVDGITDEG